MKTIEDVAGKAVKEMIASGKVEELIKLNIEKSISSAISSQFQSYGDLTKTIETAMKEGLKIDTSEIPFDSYNAQMLVAIKERLGSMFAGNAYEHFLSQIDDLLGTPPKEIECGDFLEKIAEFWKTDEPWDSDMDYRMNVEITKYDNCGKGDNDWNIKLSTGERFGDDLHLFILGGKIRINHSQSFNPTCFRDPDAYVFKLYGAGTIITGIADCDPDNLDLVIKDEEY